MVCVTEGMNHLWGYFKAQRTSATIISSCSLNEQSQLETSHSACDVPIHDRIQIVSKEALPRGKKRFTHFPGDSDLFLESKIIKYSDSVYNRKCFTTPGVLPLLAPSEI